MKGKKQRNTSNILFNTPHEYFEIKGFTFTEIKSLEKKEKKQWNRKEL